MTTSPKVEIIAELAQGFEGKPLQAELLVRAGVSAGADAIKMQLVYADELATPDYVHYPLFKQLEMEDSVWKDLAEQARNGGASLHVDVFGRKSLALAEELNLEVIKLHGTDTTNIGFLEDIATSTVPRIMLGAGGAHVEEIDAALEVLSAKQVIVMLGFQAYPTPNAANQIARVSQLAERYCGHSNVTIGFSDHAPPDNLQRFALAAAAIGAGARVVEKHLTLGVNMELEDFESALNPDELGLFCTLMRDTADAMGTVSTASDFGMSEAEKGYRKMIRRHVVARHDILKGKEIDPSDLELKRTSHETPTYELGLVTGRIASCDLTTGQAIVEEDLK